MFPFLCAHKCSLINQTCWQSGRKPFIVLHTFAEDNVTEPAQTECAEEGGTGIFTGINAILGLMLPKCLYSAKTSALDSGILYLTGHLAPPLGYLTLPQSWSVPMELLILFSHLQKHDPPHCFWFQQRVRPWPQETVKGFYQTTAGLALFIYKNIVPATMWGQDFTVERRELSWWLLRRLSCKALWLGYFLHVNKIRCVRVR